MRQQERGPSRIRQIRRQAFINGARDGVVPFIAIGTWGFVTGIAMVKSGLTESMATLMTLMVYAGSAQLTALPLIASSAPLWLIFAAGMVVNIRSVMFGAALHPFFRELSWRRRLLLGVFSSDITFVLFMSRYSDARRIGTSAQLWYFFGVAIPGWAVWNVFSLVGIFMGGLVPPEWSLEFGAILALMAVILPLIKSRPMVMCLIAAGLTAWVAQPLPLRLGLAVAVVAGVLAGIFSERLAVRARGVQ